MPFELPAPAIKTVQLVSSDAAMKPRYFDPATGRTIPNLVFVHPDGSVCFETNEVGLKGDRLDPARKLAIVWGDSVVFGAGRGWPCLLDEWAPGYQFLNGGVEGDGYDNILRRARAFNREHNVALNLVMLGWHPFRVLDAYRDRPRTARLDWLGGALTRLRAAPDAGQAFRRDLSGFVGEVRNTAVLTMPTALNPALLDGDLSMHFGPGGGPEGFTFSGGLPYVAGIQRAVYDFIVERNAMTREVCAAHGVPLIDLFARFDTTDTPDFRHYFHDSMHFRPTRYPAVAHIVFEALQNLLTT